MKSLQTLRKLRVLSCVSVNNVSDRILHTIHLLNPNCRAINYYGEAMSLCSDDYYFDEQSY